MKKSGIMRRLICGVLAVMLLSIPVCAAENDMSVTQGCRTIDGQKPLDSKDERLVKTVSAFLYDVTNDVVVYADNPDAQFSPAGLAKIMTCLIVAENADMSERVTVKQEVLDTMYSLNRGMDLQAGEELSVQDLMYCLMVKGANIAATILADHVAGSQETFVQMMNEKAAELGCTDTNFVNVHGLSDELQVTTARDVAKIVVAGMENEYFEEAFCTYVVRIPATNMAEERKISSENFLFNRNLGSNHFDGRAIGSRMGLTGNGENNIVVVAEKNDIQLISIVLGSTSEINPNGEEGCYKEARILLDKGFDEYVHVNVLHDNQILERFRVENGDCDVSGYVKVNASTSLPVKATEANLTYRFSMEQSAIKAPVKKDDQIATVEVWYENVCLAQAPMFATNRVSVQEKVVLDETVAESSGGAFTVLTIVAVIVGLLVILMFGKPVLFRIIHKRRQKQHRRYQRRSR